MTLEERFQWLNSGRKVYIDDAADWPKQTRVELDHAHADERGAIQSLVNYPVKNVSLITSKKGTIRSNHYHKTDWHYMYMPVRGRRLLFSSHRRR